jgi:peptidoglycan endopeptidase LytE
MTVGRARFPGGEIPMTLVHEPATSVRSAPPGPGLRRRRTVAALAAAVALAAAAVFDTGASWAWGVLAAGSAAGVGYALAWRWAQRRSLERQLEALLAEGAGDLGLLEDLVDCRLPSDTAPAGGAGGPASSGSGREVVRFVVSYAAGWALSPLVFALTVAVGRTPKDTAGQRWLARLQGWQEILRERSARTLAATATATAGVTAAGGATLLAGAHLAAAATAGGQPVAVTATAAAAGPLLDASVTRGLSLVSAAPSTYTVVAGDTLSGIAARFGTTWEALAQANSLSDPNLIFPGEVLQISPGASPAPSGGASAASAGTGSYTVVAGDTLSGIAARFGTTWEALAQANSLSDPNLIFPGEVLAIGPAGASSAPVSAPAPAPTPAPAVSSSAAAQIAVRTALAQLGKPYQWGGAGPDSFDCSGLVMYAWEAAGVSLPHYTVSQYDVTLRISEGQLEPGDLVFYDTGDGAQPGHVTLYIGGGQVVTADSPGTVIKVVPLDWDGTPMGFGRVQS